MVSITDIAGNSKAFETTEIAATLSDGSSFTGPVGGGQSWHSLPPGQNSLETPGFYVKAQDAGKDA